MLTFALVMLPVLTQGTVSAFLAIALPKLQKPNPTGLIIDMYQVSWLGSIIGHSYTGKTELISDLEWAREGGRLEAFPVVEYRAVLGEVEEILVDARRYCLSCCDFSYCRSSSPCLISIISVSGPAGFAGVLLVSFMIRWNVKNKYCV